MDQATEYMEESRSSDIIIVSCVTTGIAAATVALKIFARARINYHRIGWDDVFIVLSLVCSIAAAFFASYSAHLGLGRHTAAVLAEPDGPERAVRIAFYQMVGYPFNIIAFSFPNISIAILVNNLLDPNLWRTRALFTLVLLEVFFALVSVMILFLMCSPVEYLWDKSVVGGSCWSPNVMNDFSYWLSAFDALTDIVLAAIPISAFCKLQMRFKTKVGVCIMMGLTILSAIFTIIKASYLWLLFRAPDPFFDLSNLVIWGLLEQNVVIVAACIPTLRPFFHKAFKGEKSSENTEAHVLSVPSRTYRHRRSNKPCDTISQLALDDEEHQFTASDDSRNDDIEGSSRRHVQTTRAIEINMTPGEKDELRKSVRQNPLLPTLFQDI